MRRDYRLLFATALTLPTLLATLAMLGAAEPAEKAADKSAGGATTTNSSGADVVSAKGASAKGVSPEAEKVLRALCDSLSSAKSTRKDATATVRVRAKGAGGSKTVTYTITSAEPNKLAILAKGSKVAPTVVCDGEELGVQVPQMGKFVIDKAPAALDQIISSEALQGTGISQPLLAATMLDLLPADALIAKLSAAEYLGEAKVGSAKCHHLLLTIGSNEFEVWIDAGDKPHLRKVVPKLEHWLADHADEVPKDAKIDMTLVFRNWATDVKLTDSLFKFKPLDGLKQVASFSGKAGVEKEGPEVLLNKPAPRFELALVGGGSMSLAAHKGKDVVIVDFWATWCGPCVKSLPIISEVAASYKSKGVVLYAVNLRQGPEDIMPFLQEKQLPITVAMDSTGSVAETYKVSGIPTTILIGKDGSVQQVHVGMPGNLKEQLSKELDAILAGKTVAHAPK